MSLATDVAIAAAERIERTAGPGPGLAVFRRLASNAGGAELRGRAILGAVRCAIGVRDLGALRDLSQLWATVETASEESWDGLFAACKDLWRAGLGVCATDLAHAEVRRSRTARALYAFARCLDVAGDPRAGAAFGEAIERGEKEGTATIVHASRLRRASWLSRSAETLGEAIEEAKRVAPGEATPAERLVLARVMLRSSSRFTRSSALGMLDEIVSSPHTSSTPIAARAISIAARHVDDRGDDITPLEVDRILALLSREPIAKTVARTRDTVRAIDRLARAKEKNSDAELEAALDDAARLDPELAHLHRRAKDILRGRYEAFDDASALVTTTPSAHAEWTALLDAVVAMRDAAWPRTAHALRRLADSADRGVRLPPHVWTVAQAALAIDDAEVRGVAGRLVASMVKTTTAAPPRGWLGVAHALAGSGSESTELATTLRRSAALAKEPGAVDALGLALTRSGWQLAAAGERSKAIATLREARALAADGASKGQPAPTVPRRDAGPNPST